MSATTREFPCTPVVDGKPTMYPFTGQDVGPLFVHRGTHDESDIFASRGNWTITHIATGYSVHKGIHTRAIAIHMARKLAALDCWDFEQAEQCKLISAANLRKIREIRSRA